MKKGKHRNLAASVHDRPETVRAERIKEDEEYEGVRVRCEARLGSPYRDSS